MLPHRAHADPEKSRNLAISLSLHRSTSLSRKRNPGKCYASLSAQRRGWETVDGFSDYPTATSVGHGQLAKIITLPEAA